MEERLRGVVAQTQTWMLAFQLLESTAQIEIFCLFSFCVCILGSLAAFPLSANLAVALLGLICCRSGSDAQYFGYVLFAGMTTVTDVVHLCSQGSAWGGLMTLLNLFPKLAAASHCFRLCSLLGGGYPANDSLGASFVGQDYHTLSVEPAHRHQQSEVGSTTNYSSL
jgi:hypothetical protein